METTMSTTKGVIWDEIESTILPKNVGEIITKNECVTTTVTNDLNEDVLLTGIMKTRTSGIYKIVNRVNGKYYVGSSDNIEKRCKKHISDLNQNKHHSIKLQRAWNKYGERNFNIVVVEIVPQEKLLEVEQTYLDICNENKVKNYNICYFSTAPMLGKQHTEKTKEKMKISHGGPKNYMYGKRHNTETIDKIKLARRKQIFTLEHRNHIRDSLIKTDVYEFFHVESNKHFTGTQYEFRLLTNINPYYLLKRIKKKYCGWVIL